MFRVVPEIPKLLFAFLDSCFFILFWLDVYFFLLFQIIDLSPDFLSVTVGSLNILLYFGYFSFVLSFFNQAQSVLWSFRRLKDSSMLKKKISFILWMSLWSVVTSPVSFPDISNLSFLSDNSVYRFVNFINLCKESSFGFIDFLYYLSVFYFIDLWSSLFLSFCLFWVYFVHHSSCFLKVKALIIDLRCFSFSNEKN